MRVAASAIEQPTTRSLLWRWLRRFLLPALDRLVQQISQRIRRLRLLLILLLIGRLLLLLLLVLLVRLLLTTDRSHDPA
jgi:hypothetical protein